MSDHEDLPPAQEVVESVLAAADGECVVLVDDVHQAEVRFANNRTTTNGVRRDRRVTVIRYVPVEGGVAVGVSLRGGAVDAGSLVAAAADDARGSPPAEDASPLLEPYPSRPERTAFHRPPGTTDLSALSGLLDHLGGAFRRAEQVDTVLAGFAEHTVSTVYLGSTTGLRLAHTQPTGAVHLAGRADGGAASAWVGRGGDPADADPEAMEEELHRRLGWARTRIELEAGRYEVILPPDATADLMIGLVGSAGGREAEEGRTVFSAPGGGTRLGEELSLLPLDLTSDPARPGLTCRPFVATPVSGPDESVFDNGLPLGPTEWLGAGRLRRLRYHRAGAARSGAVVTPPVDNLALELPGATGSVDDLVATTRRGLLLTCLWYIREVDPATLLLTGLTRDGVYLVEDGAVVGAVNNFRFNESPVDVLARATEAGATVRALGREYGEWLNRTAMPPLRVPGFNMSSVSAAS